MPAVSKVQLTGGLFQDSEGNVLNLGYLKMKLNQDESVNDSQICHGIEIKILLNSSGSVTSSPAQSVWGNDQMLPVNSYYTVTGYNALGQICWGPNNQQVTGNGGTFDVGSWTPNSVISWTPSPQQIAFQTNETPNGDQLLLDLHAGTNITLTDNGSGQVTIAAATPTPLSLQTNEVANGSQTLLDLHAGANVGLVDNGSGRVTITAPTPLALQTNGTPNGSQALLNLAAGRDVSVTDGGSGTVTLDNTMPDASALHFATPNFVTLTNQYLEPNANPLWTINNGGRFGGGGTGQFSLVAGTASVAPYWKLGTVTGTTTLAETFLAGQTKSSALGLIKSFKIRTAVFATTDLRYWVGLTDGNYLSIPSSPYYLSALTPAANIVGFRYSAGTDAHWIAYCGTDASHTSTYDTGVSVDTTGALHDLEFRTAQGTPGTVNFYIDGVSVGTISTNVPTATTFMSPILYSEGISGTGYPAIGCNLFYQESFQ